MKRWCLLALAALSLEALTTRPAAAQSTVLCDQNPAVFPVVNIPNAATKTFVVQPNFWNAGQAGGQLCITVNNATGSFTVTTAPGPVSTNGAPAGYPHIFTGCHWGNCTNNSGMPVQVNNIGTANVFWSFTPKSTGQWNAALDIWFHSARTTQGQPDGTEIMVWANHLGPPQPFGSLIASNVTINGTTWNVWRGLLTGSGVDWNVVSYVRVTPVNALGSPGQPFDLRPFFADCQARGFLDPNWWLHSIQAGFEPWQDALGLASTGFSTTVQAGGTGGNQTLTVTKAGTGAGTVTSSPAGISCGTTCTTQNAAFTNGTSVSLSAAPNTGSSFGGWSGACSGTGGCTVAMSQARQVTATFNGPSGGGNVTVAPLVLQNTPWFHEQAVQVNNTVNITALSVQVTVQRTAGVTHAGQYNTVGSGIQQSNSGNGNPSTITYTYTLAPGQQIGPGTNRRFVAQTGGTGTPHPMSGDTWTVTYTAGGAPVTQTGTF
jgi:hypothetical protein